MLQRRDSMNSDWTRGLSVLRSHRDITSTCYKQWHETRDSLLISSSDLIQQQRQRVRLTFWMYLQAMRTHIECSYRVRYKWGVLIRWGLVSCQSTTMIITYLFRVLLSQCPLVHASCLRYVMIAILQILKKFLRKSREYFERFIFLHDFKILSGFPWSIILKPGKIKQNRLQNMKMQRRTFLRYTSHIPSAVLCFYFLFENSRPRKPR